MFRRTAVLLALALIAATAWSATRDDMVVSTEWLWHNRDRVAVIEIGDAFTFGSGHIPGARLVPFGSLVVERDGIPNELPPVEALEKVFTAAGIGDEGRVVIYSRDPLYAARAWFTLDYLGHAARAAILDGGYTAWLKEGRPLAMASDNVQPAPFHSILNPGALTTFDGVKHFINARSAFGPELMLIDVRAPEAFAGGSLPQAINIPSQENLRGGAIPLLKRQAELRDLYQKAGVTKTSTNVVFCRSGMQASLTYFVLKYLGYDVRLYDGSYAEWSRKARET